MYCLRCNNKLKVMETRTSKEECTTYRRYKCNKCNTYMYTEEYPMTDEDAKSKIYLLMKMRRIKGAE